MLTGPAGLWKHRGMLPGRATVLVVLLALGAGACSEEKAGTRGAGDAGAQAATAPAADERAQEDLAGIRARGRLRLLLPGRQEPETLPRSGFPPDLERRLAEEFARRLALEPVPVEVDSYQALIPSLLEGRGDVLVASLTVTPERKKLVSFTTPVAVVSEQVVTRQDDDLSGPAGLAGRTIAVRKSSSYWSTARGLAKKYPGLRVKPVPENLDTEQVLYRVARGELDLTLADSNLVQAVSAYTPGLKVAFAVGGPRLLAWAVRPEAQRLRRALDEFLSEVQLAEPASKTYRGDLPAIAKRRVLRVLTRNSAATYFLWRGELMGFEYELVREFARRHDLYVKLVVPPSRDDLIPWLREGRGDLVAAALTITGERRGRGVAFSRPYNYVTETVVCRRDDEKCPAGPAGLAGRTVVVRRSSAYWKTLARLQADGVALTLQAAPEEFETEEIIARVAAGAFDLTVADSHIVDIELTYRDDIKSGCALGGKVAHGWALRADNPLLKKAVDRFFDKEYRGVFYNIIRRKYFHSPRSIRKRTAERAARTGRISPFDDLFRKFAGRFGFDWRLIAAQAHVESRFDPRARSWAGARGLMQVTPGTAKEMGLADATRPADNVHAGVKYLARLRGRFAERLPVNVRNWFALAAYNAGYGHVLDARRLARRQGWDPDRWFANVERAMLLLSRPRYARTARYGYCRGSEPFEYVRRIRDRYRAYLRASRP